jgi:hypothetical protein
LALQLQNLLALAPAPGCDYSSSSNWGSRRVSRAQVCFFFLCIYFIIHILLTLLHQTWKAYESQCGPTTAANEGHHKTATAERQ